MSVYLDTSALAKLVVSEAETEALRSWLQNTEGSSLVVNAIGAVELQRIAARVSQAAVSVATLLLARIDRMELNSAALALAASLPPPAVRTLDALHIASAAQLGDLTALVTYDDRMAAAAIGYGLPVASPGR